MFIIIEHVVILFVVLFVVTQLLIPIVLNRPTFPLFRWRGKQQQLDEVLQEIENARLEAEIERQKRKAAHFKHTEGETDATSGSSNEL